MTSYSIFRYFAVVREVQQKDCFVTAVGAEEGRGGGEGGGEKEREIVRFKSHRKVNLC